MRSMFLLLLPVFFVSCAKNMSQPTSPNADQGLAMSAPQDSLPQNSEQALVILESQIDEDLSALGLAPLSSFGESVEEPIVIREYQNSPAAVDTESGSTYDKRRVLFGKKKKKKEEKQEETCQQICEVVDSICEAAERICQIAERLPEKSNPKERCERANNACERARKQNCTCESS